MQVSHIAGIRNNTLQLCKIVKHHFYICVDMRSFLFQCFHTLINLLDFFGYETAGFSVSKF